MGQQILQAFDFFKKGGGGGYYSLMLLVRYNDQNWGGDGMGWDQIN